MNNKKLIIVSSLALILSPMISLAAAASLVPLPGVITDLFVVINAVFAILWPLFAAFAVIMFIYAGFLFLNASGDAGKVGDARQAVLWGTVGIAVGLLAFSIPFIIKLLIGV